MNSRQSFANSHHSNLELAPAFGGSPRLLRGAQQSALPWAAESARVEESSRHFQEDGHAEGTAAKLWATASRSPETVHHRIFLFINTTPQMCLPVEI